MRLWIGLLTALLATPSIARSPAVRTVILDRQPAAIVATTTFDPAKNGADNVLSGGNLIATRGAGGSGTVWEPVLAIAGHSTGKFYVEFTVGTASSSMQVGLANSSVNLSGFLGSDNNSCGVIANGTLFNLTGGPVGSFTNGDVVSMAVDMGNNKIWFRTNGGSWDNVGGDNPATNTGGFSIATLNAGPYFPAVATETNGDKWTANFGGSAYAQSVPAGFGNW